MNVPIYICLPVTPKHTQANCQKLYMTENQQFLPGTIEFFGRCRIFRPVLPSEGGIRGTGLYVACMCSVAILLVAQGQWPDWPTPHLLNKCQFSLFCPMLRQRMITRMLLYTKEPAACIFSATAHANGLLLQGDAKPRRL
jgi:hypothetical protein